MDNQRAILDAAPYFERLSEPSNSVRRLSHSAIWDSQRRGQLVERNIESPDEVFPARLDIPRSVFREVLAGLRDEIAEPLKHIVTHPIAVGHSPFGSYAMNFGI